MLTVDDFQSGITKDKRMQRVLDKLVELRLAEAASDCFADRAGREQAIKGAVAIYGSAQAVADKAGVTYSALRSWARDRGSNLAKGTSAKVVRIEAFLKPLIGH